MSHTASLQSEPNGGANTRPPPRALSFLAALIVVAGICALLVWASRTHVWRDMFDRAGVEVMLAPKETHETRNVPRPQARPSATPNAPQIETTPEPTDQAIDQAAMQRALSCFARNPEERPPNCPPAPPVRVDNATAWRMSPGGRVGAPEPLNMDTTFTRAERATLVMPDCMRDKDQTFCARFGTVPPPPARSPEEICEEGGIGPCRPPEFSGPDYSVR